MSKPRKIGLKSTYIPNARADMRHRKKVYQRSRENGGNNMSYSIKACAGCVAPKRHPGCHDHCPEYLQDKAAYESRKAAADKQKAIKAGLDAQAIDGVYRARKKRKGRWE